VITLYFDGLCLPRNPRGIACYAFIVYINDKRVKASSGLAARPWSEEATNNVAEYTGLLKGLKWLLDNPKLLLGQEVIVKGDSKLVIMQMRGEYKVRSARLLGLYNKCKELISRIGEVKFEWIPRSKNEETDRLTKLAYERYITKSGRP
jgi:ribonuclease HI